MLTSLLIQNFALIEDLTIDFGSGLTVITGETGAGKSIVFDALSLALGERADTTLIRNGAQKAVIEASFSGTELLRFQQYIMEAGAEWIEPMILRREISVKGTSRCFINDSPVSVGSLKELGDGLVDIHGQHEHQSLLHPETHIGILDSYAELHGLSESYAQTYGAFMEAGRNLQDAVEKKNTLEEKKAITEYHLREITAVNPLESEDDEIEQELRRAEHSERIALLSRELLDLLYDGESNASDLLGRSKKLLQELQVIDTGTEQWGAEILAAIANVTDVAQSIRTYAEKMDFHPDYCDELRHRLVQLQGLKRKFRLSIPEIISKKLSLENELDSYINIDDTIEALDQQVKGLRNAASKKAKELTAARKKSSVELAKAVITELRQLGILHAQFETRFSQQACKQNDEAYLTSGSEKVIATANGWDHVEFYLSTNLGEDVKPLAKVVSGGEVSRIMLALKTIFAGKATVPVMVFDEIDVGVSGNIAQKVGNAMKLLSAKHQIIAITHLPQIASAGDAHLLVEKIVEGQRTITKIRTLNKSGRVDEVARLMSGASITNASRQSAEELITSYL